MKELLRQYAAYNHWANRRITELILQLPEEKQLAEVESSFNSLYKTLLHTWDAESGWWQRLKLQERVLFPSADFKGNTAELVSGLLQQSRLWEEWAATASELMLDHVFQYQTRKGEQIKQPIFQMLLHVFNHSTYHRGQLVTLLRQLGVTKIPSTDFTAWALLKK